MAVDWVMFGAEHFTENHAHHFMEGVMMPGGMDFDPRASIPATDVGFTRFLLNFFCHTLLPAVRKNMTLNLDRQRYSISSRSQLNEQLGRLLCHLLSAVHVTPVRAAVLRQLWSTDDSRYILNSVLNSTLKKTLGSRLVLTILHLHRHVSRPHPHTRGRDPDLGNLLGDLFDLVCRSGSTRLKAGTELSSLAAHDPQREAGDSTRDSKKRHKFETNLEDMRNLDQRWQERYEYDIRGFALKQKTTYSKLVEKARERQQVVDRSSESVSTHIFGLQSQLRKSFLEQMSKASVTERDNLRQWRRVILLNTHLRALWSKDECRTMCWQLDPTEGPGRVRRRMMRAPLTIHSRHILTGSGRHSEDETTLHTDKTMSPLSFIFDNTAYSGTEGIFNKVVPQKGEDINHLYNWKCSNISPDNCCRGHLILSNMRCYFVGDEPLGDPNITKVLPSDEEVALLSWQHSEVVEIHRRRYMLKDDALEIFLISGKTMLLSFESTAARNTVHATLLQLDLPNMVDSGESESEKLKSVTHSWQQGEITNFEYLMELNKLAGRTFNDLMQYPVFPFILADYHSSELDLRKPESFRKFRVPISVQDESRAKKYLDTYKFLANERRASAAPGLSSISDKPYHYGSHYSNSGIVLHFLVRLPPFTEMFLAFQGGSFDIADRTFRKLETTWWLSSSESATDVKELVPEFFFLPEFLANSERFNFGECQTGERVDHVILPPWAKDDRRLFVLKHRQALESDFVSRNLHEWIDLVFGFKQTGKAAVQAINVFHPATYYGADGIDIDSVTDPTQQAAMRAMVKTYGQMPLQLFRDPHPPRSKNSILTSFRIRIGSALRWLSAAPPTQRTPSLYFWMHVSSVKARIPLSGSECDFIGTPGSPDLVFAHDQSLERVPERISVVGGGELIVTGLQTAYFPSSSPATAGVLVVWGTWDNSLVLRSTACESTAVRLHSHPLNKVTCCECVRSGQMIVSGGSAGTISFWTISNTPSGLSYTGKAVHLRGHDGPINCMMACKPFGIVVTGSADHTCIIWDTNRLSYVNTLGSHEGPVSVVATSPTLGDIASVCTALSRPSRTSTTANRSSEEQLFYLRVWTINGHLVRRVSSKVQIKCLQYSSAPEGVYINVLAGGLANGNINLWSSWDLSLIREVPCPLPTSYPVLSIGISSLSKELYAGYSNRQLVAWVKPRHEFREEQDFEHLGLEPYFSMSKRL
ncbi:Lysosomal-trafficking regulator [Geodia barretti]|uniref:Lysosomal-trafficking regulator n=1 Tax=Geodia barretti TaxID=519541 RepID=A0AA35WS79_GEOBA|nr:Lysosomal-trafficking regulator [Geodia barretti]